MLIKFRKITEICPGYPTLPYKSFDHLEKNDLGIIIVVASNNSIEKTDS